MSETNNITVKLPKSKKALTDEKMREMSRPLYRLLKDAPGPLTPSTLAADSGLTVVQVYDCVSWMRIQGVKLVYTATGFRLGSDEHPSKNER